MSEIIHHLKKDVKQIEIEGAYLDEPLDGNFIGKINAPFFKGEFHFLVRTKKNKKLFIEKYPRLTLDGENTSIDDSPEFMNEYFESNLLKVMIASGILKKEKFLAPSIKLSNNKDIAYYSEFIPNTISSLNVELEKFERIAAANNISIEEAKSKLNSDEFGLMNGKAEKMTYSFREELTTKENAAPLALLQLISGAGIRNMSNYRFQIDKTQIEEPKFKIVIMDLAGGLGNRRDEPGIIDENLLSNLTREDVMAYWPKIKTFIEENDLVNKIIDKLPVPQELKDIKRNEVLSNINNLENLLAAEFADRTK